MLNILGISRFLDLSLQIGSWTIPFSIAIGVLPYPLTFLCTDFISEIYGKKRAAFVVWLGLLVNERTLHDGLEDVVAGVNDSKFARWLLRHYRKKGVQALGQEEAPAEEEEGGNQR